VPVLIGVLGGLSKPLDQLVKLARIEQGVGLLAWGLI
jgi:hypothetical protein